MRVPYKRLLTNKALVVGFILFVFVSTVFVLTAARYHVSVADSDEFGVLGYTLGVAHAPGYPVYILLLFLTTHFLPFLGSVYFRESILSGLLSAISAALLYASILKLLPKEDQVPKLGAAFLGTCTVAFSLDFWFFANIPEVFALNSFFVALLLYLSLSFARDFPKSPKKLLVVLAVISGIMLSHLQTSILIFIPLAGYIVVVLRKHQYKISAGMYLLLALLVAGGCFLPFMLLEVYAGQTHQLSWAIQPGLQGLFAYIFRQNYASGSIVSAYQGTGSIFQGIGSLFPYISYLGNDFLFFPLLFALLGIIYIWKQYRLECAYLLSIFVLAGPVFVMYAGIPQLPETKAIFNVFLMLAILLRQTIMSDLIFAIFIGAGLYATYKGVATLLVESAQPLRMFGRTFMWDRKAQGMLVMLLVGIPVVLFECAMNWSQVDMHTLPYIQSYARQTLESASFGGIIICFSDTMYNSLVYEQVVDHTREDVTIVPANNQVGKPYLDTKSGLRHFHYTSMPYILGDVVSWNIHEGRQVYVTDIPTDYITYLGLDGKAFFMIPAGTLFRVVEKLPAQNPGYDDATIRAFERFMSTGNMSRNFWFVGMSGYLMHSLTLEEYTSLQSGDIKDAVTIIKLEHTLNSLYETNAEESADIASAQKDTAEATASDSAEALYTLSLKGGRDALAYARFAVLKDPLNTGMRLSLAKLYRQTGDIALSRQEYLNVLRIDPHNTVAHAALLGR